MNCVCVCRGGAPCDGAGDGRGPGGAHDPHRRGESPATKVPGLEEEDEDNDTLEYLSMIEITYHILLNI